MRSERLKPFLEGSVRIFQYPSSQAHHGPVIFIIDMYIFSIGPWMISKCFQSLQFPKNYGAKMMKFSNICVGDFGRTIL